MQDNHNDVIIIIRRRKRRKRRKKKKSKKEREKLYSKTGCNDTCMKIESGEKWMNE